MEVADTSFQVPTRSCLDCAAPAAQKSITSKEKQRNGVFIMNLFRGESITGCGVVRGTKRRRALSSPKARGERDAALPRGTAGTDHSGFGVNSRSGFSTPNPPRGG